MPPHTRVHFKVTGAITAKVWIVPQVDGHRWHRLGDDQLAGFLGYRLATFVEGVDTGTEGTALQLAGAHGQQRAADDERAGDVGAAADRSQPQVGLDRVIDPGEAF